MQNIFLPNWMFRIKDVLMPNDDLKDDMEIVLYKGYGNNTTVFVSGMVIAGKKVRSFSNNSKWENMRAMIRRFTRKTVANQEVNIDLLGEQTKVITDGSGSFSVQLKLPYFYKIQSDRWIPVKAIIPNTSVKVTGQIQIINDDEERIFISDIDDTVLISHSTHLFRKLYLILFKNAESRLPFPDIPRFYQQLKSGRSNNSDHPFFYVSSSEWNLYDLLNDFFKFNQIPEGTLLLKKYSGGIIKLWLSGKKHHDLKSLLSGKAIPLYRTTMKKYNIMETTTKTYRKLGFTGLDTAEMVSTMNIVLANYHIFYQKLRNYHWNVKGGDFFDLHEKFEELYTAAVTNIDEVAERIRVFGKTPMSTLGEYLQVAEIKETGTDLTPIQMTQQVLGDIEKLDGLLVDVAEAAQKAGDMATLDLMNSMIRSLEKEHWMLTMWLNNSKN
nr:phosphatase domain-containing protein [uncultured Carboxylicivirga sp.]